MDQIGRYRTERVLGTGAFGTVWLAHDETLEAQVAIKVVLRFTGHESSDCGGFAELRVFAS